MLSAVVALVLILIASPSFLAVNSYARPRPPDAP